MTFPSRVYRIQWSFGVGGGGGVGGEGVKIGVGRENSNGYFGGLGWSVIWGYK